MIHISKIPLIIERNDERGNRVPFTISFIKKSTGEIVHGECICTSYFGNNKTLNLKFVSSGQTRKIHLIQIIKFNNKQVFV